MINVYFIGAGPGDPELITVKGQRLISEADVIIYAGSLVNAEILKVNTRGAGIYDSAGMTLPQVIEVMKTAAAENKMVARVHTGDPAIYGAIGEQMEELDKLGLTYEIIPGVSSFLAAASRVQKELTLSDVTQTVICTRVEGRTPVPELEKLELLASHRCSMALFLSVSMIDKAASQLMTHYPPSTPIAVIKRATWPDEMILTGTLETISAQVEKAAVKKTAMILVGDALENRGGRSRLYDRSFTHEYREAEKP